MSNAQEDYIELDLSNQTEFIANQSNHEHDRLPDYILHIERLVERAISTDGLSLKINAQDERLQIEGTYLEIIQALLKSYRPEISYSLKTELFYSSCRELGWNESLHNTQNTTTNNNLCNVDFFNQLIDLIRQKGHSRAFKQAELKRASNADRGFESAQRYVNSLFIRYARLCVVRIDLAYLSKTSESEVDLSRVQRDYKTFIHGWREKSVFKNMVGYVAKLEYGETKKHHFHLMLFFDGSKSHQDISIAMRIGEYWKSITHQDGTFFICNAFKSKYRYLGIGMVSHDDVNKRYNLKIALEYFFKKEQYLNYKYKEKTRTHFRGEINRNEKAVSGRPRRVNSSIQQSLDE